MIDSKERRPAFGKFQREPVKKDAPPRRPQSFPRLAINDSDSKGYIVLMDAPVIETGGGDICWFRPRICLELSMMRA